MIKVENLCQVFGVKKAVDDLSFTVEKGQVLGLIGPNGAGKSTSMRMITGYLRPTAGKVHLCGLDVWADPIEAKKLLGYLPEHAPLFDDLTVDEFLHYLGSLRGYRGKELGKACDRAVELCFLEDVRHQLIDTLSKGYRHRTCLAQSLLHDPQVIIFDEPTDGLDPNQKEEIRSLINRFREDKAIILSTHILEEVSAVCTDVLLIDRGKKVFEGTPADLRAHTPSFGNVFIRLNSSVDEALRKKMLAIEAVQEVEWAESSPEDLCILPHDRSREQVEKLAIELMNAAQEEQADVVEIRYDEGSLEKVFRAMTIHRPVEPSERI